MRTGRSRILGLIIFAVSWTLRIALVLAIGSYRQPVNAVETVQVARSLAAGEGFSNPYGCITGPTVHLAPVYPFLLSLIYRTLPPGSSRELTVFILGITIVSLMYALLPWLAVKLRLHPLAGVLAGFAGASLPLFFWVEVTSEWEARLTALLLVVALGKLAGLFELFTIRRLITAGIIWGVTLLTAPTLLPVFVALSIALLWRTRLRPAVALRTATALWLPAILVIMPWTIRNYGNFHEFIPVRGNAGLQLHMSFNPMARATFDEGALSGAFVDHPYSTPQVCREFARFGEIAMNRRFERQAIEWIGANPGRSAALIAEHFAAFWRMAVPSRAKTAASELLTFAGLAGLGYCFRKHTFAGRMIGIVVLVYPLAYYVNFFEPRYRYPLHPLFLLTACVLLIGAARRFQRRSGTRSDL
jgi:hypothetical protein